MRKTKSMQPADSDMVAIGGGYFLTSSFVSELISTLASEPAKFFRKVMYRGGLFSMDELARSSFISRKSAKKGRPPLDPSKLNAVLDFTASQCNLQLDSPEYAEFYKKIRYVCCDARKFVLQTKRKSKHLSKKHGKARFQP